MSEAPRHSDTFPPRAALSPAPLIGIEEVMRRCGRPNANRSEFVKMARRTGLRRYPLTRRTIMYDPADVELWLRRASLGIPRNRRIRA